MDENPFGGDEDDLAPIESKGEDDEATPSRSNRRGGENNW